MSEIPICPYCRSTKYFIPGTDNEGNTILFCDYCLEEQPNGNEWNQKDLERTKL